MVWRAPAVEAVLGVPVDETTLSTDVLQHVVDIAAREGEQLDFKSKPHLPEKGPSPALSTAGEVLEKGWSAEQEFAKDVCAFANHMGGLMLVGVRDEEEVAVEVMAPPVTDPGALEQRLRQALVNYAAPVPRFQCIPIAESGGFYLAIVVPASITAPHAVRGASSNAKRPLHYPVRDGADTRWLLEHEIADRYRARAASRDERIALREDVVAKGVEALARAPEDDLWLYVAIAPESTTQALLDQPTVAAISGWLREYGFVSPLERMLLFRTTPLPAPGRVTATAHQAHRAGKEEADPDEQYVELYADGRAFAATAVVARSDDEGDHRALGELTLADDALMLVDLVVSWAAHQAGAWGEAEAVVGLVRSASDEFAQPVTIHAVVGGDLRRIAGTRSVRGSLRSSTSVDLSAGSTQLGRLAAARDVLTVFLHHFGISEPRQLEPGGRIVPWAWSRHERQVERWARERDLPAQEGDHSSWRRH
ncbi:helix-turn-helix domain-containing protein [Nocardioides pantholopis]|uniref:AlbA family DNA-binding domain-containing protein n=1 Tax=Nocardioides pantholopis TaxID=2483798 RepID=UPI000FDCA072|nr:ATP-binding protein [Nocardioides pantholopis]